MTQNSPKKVALVLPGQKDEVSPEQSRLSAMYQALTEASIDASLVLYSDDRVVEIENELTKYDLILVWINPIHQGKTRQILDEMLLRLAKIDIVISADPNIILKMGTKDILYQTKKMDWGVDTEIYGQFEDFMTKFPNKLKAGPRVLKQHRGNGGLGVWRIEMVDTKDSKPLVSVLHAERGSMPQKMSMDELGHLMKQYYFLGNHLIDQQFQQRITEGMIRCYLSLDKVVGFGHQYVSALMQPIDNKPLEPPPRYYYSKTKEDFQDLKNLLENKWVRELQELLGIPRKSLPILWDADFLFGEKDTSGNDTYVLCEINVSSVFPYPEEAHPDIIHSILEVLN